MKRPSSKRKSPPGISLKRIREMIEDATVDCYTEDEAVTGFLTVLDDHLQTPFRTEILGIEVTVEKVDFNKADDIVAVCRRGNKRLNVPIIDLPLPDPPPIGWEWIEAYRRWIGGR